MASKYTEYKKRRLKQLQQRVFELETALKQQKVISEQLYRENTELKSTINYYETTVKR